MNVLTIPFETDTQLGNESLLYVGDKSRYSTMTSVALLGRGLLACANYYTRRLMIVVFDGPGVLYAVFCNGAPKPRLRPRYASPVVRYEIDLAAGRGRKTAELRLEDCHVDACKFHEGRLYVAAEPVDSSRRGGVYVMKVSTGRTIDLEGVLGAYDFPHGIDIAHGLMAVASYGTSDVLISEFS